MLHYGVLIIKHKNYIIEMIKTGNLLDLNLGKSVEDIHSIIKESAGVITLNDKLDLWSYGYGLELYFENDKLTQFSIRYNTDLGIFDLPESFHKINNNVFEGLDSLDNLIDILDGNNIEWEINKNLCDDTMVVISCNTRTDICYDIKNHYIYSIQSRPQDWWIEQNEHWQKKNNRE